MAETTVDFDAGPYCKSCPATVIWAFTTTAKPMLVDAQPVPNGNLRLVARPNQRPRAEVVKADLAYGRTDLRVAHFVTCPNAASHRRKRAHA